MGAVTGGEVTKAVFSSEDWGYEFEVQYNPINFKYTRSATWKEHEEQGTEATLEFQKLSAATMSCDLIFDTTKDGSDVRSAWVNRFIEFTNPEVTPADGEAAELDKLRPHVVRFSWGGFDMTGVIESVTADYVMFSAEGSPLRAKVQIKMKEWIGEDRYSSWEGAAGYSSAPVKLVTLEPGQTVSAVAAQLGTTAQEIGELNDLDDLMDVPAGTVLAVYS